MEVLFALFLGDPGPIEAVTDVLLLPHTGQAVFELHVNGSYSAFDLFA